MPYRPPELFTVETNSSVDERTDIWVIVSEDLENLFFIIFNVCGFTIRTSSANSINGNHLLIFTP